jgi:hypothetical protein
MAIAVAPRARTRKSETDIPRVRFVVSLDDSDPGRLPSPRRCRRRPSSSCWDEMVGFLVPVDFGAILPLVE